MFLSDSKYENQNSYGTANKIKKKLMIHIPYKINITIIKNGVVGSLSYFSNQNCSKRRH
jgi:hypothetical protein